MPDQIVIPGHNTIDQKEVTLTDMKTKEKQRRIVVYTNMLERNIPECIRIHNLAWEKDLSLSEEQGYSYHREFGHFLGICAYVYNEQDPARSTLIAAIKPMRINILPRFDGIEPDIWNLAEGDNIPSKWDELTNSGFFDTAALRGPWRKIWPAKKGRTVICPTVYTLKEMTIDDREYRIGPVMKGIIGAVKKRVELLVADEMRGLLVCAFSAPKGKERYPDMRIDDYLLTSKPNEEMEIAAKICERDGVIGEERQKRLHEAYVKSGGEEPFDRFAGGKIGEFAIMQEGKSAFTKFKRKHGYTRVDEFLRVTRRKPLDPVIGQHIFCGARIGRIIPNGRKDPSAMDYNMLMVYDAIMVETMGPSPEPERKADPN